FGQLTAPPHLFGNLFVGLVGMAILIEQFAVLFGAGIAFLEKFLVIVFVPGFFGIFLAAFVLFDGFGKSAHEMIHALCRLLGALLVLSAGHAPFWRGDGDFIIGAFDNDAPVGITEPLQINAIGHMLGRLFLPAEHRQSIVE